MNLGCFQSYLASLAEKMLYKAAIFIYSCTQRVYERLEVILADTHSFNAANLLRKIYQPVAARLVRGSPSLHMYTCQSGPKILLNRSSSAPHILFYTMAGRAKSDVDKAYACKHVYEALMVWDIVAYKADQKKPKKDRCGYRKICLNFESHHFLETGKYIYSILNDIQFIFSMGNQIKLCHMTLKQHVGGGMMHERANAEWSWLTNSEVTIIINFINEMAHRGFPLSHERLKEHVNDICSARLGPAFPVQGVGVNWTYRFSKKHSEQIKIARSWLLEDKQGCATNPHNNEAWWKLPGDTVKKYKIEEENTYASDEVGIQAQGGGERKYVFGPRTKAAPYQQRSGTCENITTIVTICADGTSTPPAIIFKGSAYQVKWGENNPLNASYVILLIIIFTCVN